MEVKLIWEEVGKDGDGFPKKEAHSIDVCLLREKSVVRTEVYDSMRAGVSVKTVLEIRQEDWEETKHLVDNKPEYARKASLNGCEYDIVRTYKVGKSKIELVCG